MSDNLDDSEQEMEKMKEISAQMAANLKRLQNLRDNFDHQPPNDNLLNLPEQSQFNQLFLRMVEQQNQFHERLLNKLDEIIKALKK